VIVKVLVDVHPMELATCRFVGVLLPVLPILIYRQEDPFPKGSRLALVARCFVGTTGLMLSFYAFRHMPLADASVVVFSVPVFVAVFARIFLKVKLSATSLKYLYSCNRKAVTFSDLTKFYK
jgi:drug/metabolite transporter (DMT)-like permease